MKQCPECNGKLIDDQGDPCQCCNGEGFISEKDFRYYLAESIADDIYKENRLQEIENKNHENGKAT